MAKKILIAILTLSGLMPLFMASLCFFANEKALEFLKMTYNQDVYQLTIIFGICLISIVASYVLTIAWVLKNKPEGYTLSKITGTVVITSGIILWVGINRPDLGLPDLVKGILMVAATFWAERQLPLPALKMQP